MHKWRHKNNNVFWINHVIKLSFWINDVIKLSRNQIMYQIFWYILKIMGQLVLKMSQITFWNFVRNHLCFIKHLKNTCWIVKKFHNYTFSFGLFTKVTGGDESSNSNWPPQSSHKHHIKNEENKSVILSKVKLWYC